MFEETPIKPPEEKDQIEALSEILSKFEQRPLLQKIEKHTAVLPTLLRALTITKGTKAAHFYLTGKSGKPLKEVTERLRGSKNPVAVKGRTPRIVPGASVRAAARNVAPDSPAVPSPVAPAAPIAIPASPAPAPATPRRATPAPARTPRAPATGGTTAAATQPRAANGRFGAGASVGQRERERQRSEEPAKGLKGWLKAAIGAVLGKGKEKEGDIQDAAGKAIGGPIWEAAKEMQGAVGELKEKLQDDKTLLGKTYKWLGKKTGIGTGRNAAPTEGAEQRRHRELIQTIEGHSGGGGGGGVGGGLAEAIGGGASGAVGGTLLSKIPGAKTAGKFLTKLSPLISVLTAGTTLAAVGIITVAAAGFAGVMNILKRGQDNGVGYGPTPEQSKALTPQGPPTAAEKARWNVSQDNHTYDSAIATASKSAGVDANLVKGVISQESGFDPKAVSSAGAQGLMQLMPATATALGVKNSFDPSQNIQGGTRHLSGLLNKYGNEATALQAYNWGDGNMDAYLKTGKGLGGQPMPQETVEYANKVLRRKAMYEQIGQTPTATAQPTAQQAKPQAVPAIKQLKEVPQPTSMQELAPAPLTAQLMGTEKLVAALNKQTAPSKENTTLAPIKPHYDDTVLTLMAHDRI